MAQTVYFKNLVNIEITKLVTLCDKWNDKFSKGDAPEEEKGNILALLGQTNLLIKEKIKQFTDLIQACENKDPSQKITNDDLQGFWDLVSIQIDDINQKFKKLELKEANKWKPLEETTSENNNDLVRRKIKIVKPSKSVEEAAKLRLTAAKQAMKERLKNK